MQNKNEEVAFFTPLADEDYAPLSDDLHDFVISIIGPHVRGKILEAGCGTGVLGRKLSTADITGVDICPSMIRTASLRSKHKYIVGDLEDKNLFPAGSFDTIICPWVLHHFPDIDTVAQNLKTWCKPGGHIILVEPNGDCLVNRLSKLVRDVMLLTGKSIASYGTSNETDHKCSVYLSHFSDCDAICIERYGSDMHEAKSRDRLVQAKQMLYGAAKWLPQKFGEPGLIIIFRNG